MFLVSPVGGVSEHEERDVTDYFQKRYRESHHGGLNFFVNWLEVAVNTWRVGFVTYSFFIGAWLDSSDRRCFFLSNACSVWCVFRKRK